MSFHEIDVKDLPAWRDAIEAMISRRFVSLVVRNAIPREVTDAFLAAAGREPPVLPTFPSAHFSGRTVGQVLVVSPPDLRSYFESAMRLREVLTGLGEPCASLEGRFSELLGGLSGGRTARAPENARGDRYCPFTTRELVPGGSIAPHCENETLRFPAMAQLGGVIDPTTQLSFYVPLALPEGGGELELSSAEFGVGFGAALGSLDRTSAKTLEALAARRATVLRPGIGDLLVFDAGRYYHLVSTVQGSRARWTMGGFLAFSRARDVVHFWG